MRWVHYATFISKENVSRRGAREIFFEDEVQRPEARNPIPRHVSPSPAHTSPDQEILMWRVRKTPRRRRCFAAGGLREASARIRFHGGGLREASARIRFPQEAPQEAKVNLQFFGFTTRGL